MKTKILFLVVAMVCSLVAAVAIGARKAVIIKGGKFCGGHLLKKIAKEKARGSRMVKLRAFNPDDETLSPSLKDWVRRMREDRLVAFELKGVNPA